MNIDPTTRMRDVPMLDSDRELMRAEFHGFDEMPYGEWREAVAAEVNGLLDTISALKEAGEIDE